MTDLYLHRVRTEAEKRLASIVADLSETDAFVAGRGSVYATGSYGRLEAGPPSDLDLFVMVATEQVPDRDPTKPDRTKPLIGGLDEIKLKYQLIRVNEKHNLPAFDGDGKFLDSHTIESYTKWLGSKEDDYHNKLTGRMLLLLESRPLVGRAMYDHAIDTVIKAYFRDYVGNEDRFVPSFLFNDILRMWRTFCVNYEFYRKQGDPANKIKNLKLKFSRMLTCYSGIIYLMAVYARQGTLHPADVTGMVGVSPTERLEMIGDSAFWEGTSLPGLARIVEDALTDYSAFLEVTHRKVDDAVAIYAADEPGWRTRSYAFGARLSNIIDALGTVSVRAAELRRLIVI